MNNKLTESLLGFGKETLVDAIPRAVSQYLDHAIGAIDERLGSGFAKENPALVAAYLGACSTTMGNAFVALAIEAMAGPIAATADE